MGGVIGKRASPGSAVLPLNAGPEYFESPALIWVAASRCRRWSSVISEEPFPNDDGIPGLNDVFELGIDCLRLSVDDSLNLDPVRGRTFGEAAGQADGLLLGRSLRYRVRAWRLQLPCHICSVAVYAWTEYRV